MQHTHTFDLAGVCTGPGPCDTTPFGAGKNWVNSVGGLPLYIRAIAQALHRSGHSESSAIATAVATVKRWAAGGGGVSAATRARAAAALAEWERKKAQAHSLAEPATGSVDLAFNGDLHPRAPKGAAGGGRFVAKGSSGGGAVPANVAANVRDFQRRMHLPVTGRLDPATVAAIRKQRAAKRGGGGKSKKARVKAAARRVLARQRQQLGQRVSHVNSMSPAARAQIRKSNPIPPTGYVWTASDSLRKVARTKAQNATAPIGV